MRASAHGTASVPTSSRGDASSMSVRFRRCSMRCARRRFAHGWEASARTARRTRSSAACAVIGANSSPKSPRGCPKRGSPPSAGAPCSSICRCCSTRARRGVAAMDFRRPGVSRAFRARIRRFRRGARRPRAGAARRGLGRPRSDRSTMAHRVATANPRCAPRHECDDGRDGPRPRRTSRGLP